MCDPFYDVLMKACDLSVMKAHCKSCHFKPDEKGIMQDAELATRVVSRTLFQAHQLCHEPITKPGAKVPSITIMKFMIVWALLT